MKRTIFDKKIVPGSAVRLVLWLMLAFIAADVSAVTLQFKNGVVMARSVVLNDNGQPILVEYDEQGNEVREVSIPAEYENDIDSLTVMSAAGYRFYEQQLKDYREDHADDLALGAELMDIAEYNATEFLAANGPQAYPKPSLSITGPVKSVLVRGRSNRLLPATQEALILLQFPINLANPGAAVFESDRAVVLSPEGAVIATSQNNIAYRVGFFGDPNEPQSASGYLRRPDDQVFGPVEGIKVSVDEFVYPGGIDVTNAEGRYSFRFLLPTCPIGGFEFTTDVWAELRYKNFLPIGSPFIPYYLRRQEWSYCYASFSLVGGLVPVYQEHQPDAYPLVRSDLKVDVMVLTGRVSLQNLDGTPVPIADTTVYSAFDDEEETKAQTYYDFNGDGTDDTVVKGRRKTVQDVDGNDVVAFVPEDLLSGGEKPDLQGVYFKDSDVPGTMEEVLEQQPDLVRILDTEKRIDDAVGILESISVDDYKNTDILFFRESTGQLVMERRGLRDENVNRRRAVAYDEEVQQVAYRVMLRGPRDSQLNIGGGYRGGGYEQWAVDNMLTEPFRSRDSDHLKPGERVKIVALNRATGYVGTASVQLSSAANDPAGLLSITVPDIVMAPPNLKIWAEREYQVEQGLTKGEGRSYTIGSEGAGLASDTLITIFTEWLDSDGSPLPDELGLDNGEQYGLTGRLAKVVSPNTLQGASVGGSDLAEFPIAAGRKIQAINVRSNLSTAEHYYIHVIGKPKDQECVAGATCASFDSTGDTVGAAPPYDTRPALLTPFKVPLFDEDTHWQTYNAYRRLKEDYDPADPNSIDPTKPLPSYAWQYRPEYQFSQFELEIQEVNRVENAGTADETKTNIFSKTTPTIASSDDLIEALYSLFSSDYERLTPIDGKQELVLALGEEEQLITVGEDKTITFDNIEHLAALSPEDFLSMRLYANNDAGNILWEWAFEHLVLDTQLAEYNPSTGDTLYVSADNPVVPLQAFLVGYADRDPEIKEPITLLWNATGGATLEKNREENDDLGVFFNELTLPTNAGAVSDVSVKLIGVDETTAQLPPIEVIPGAPAQITHQISGQVHVANATNATITFDIRDQFGNPVADGTGVGFFVGESLELVSGDDVTTAGKAAAVVTGADFDLASTLRINVGEIEQIVPITVSPLNIALDVNDQINSGGQTAVNVTVTDSNGNPVAGVDVELGSSYGFIANSVLVTNANGEATTTYSAPGSKGNGDITAQVALIPAAKRNVAVVYADAASRDLEVDNAAMIGDTAAAGITTYERYDTTLIDFEYPTSRIIQALGQQGDTVTVTIGDVFDPNLAPLAAYYMNDVSQGRVDDDTGHYPLFSQNLGASYGTRLGAGNSFFFNSAASGNESKLWADNVALLQRNNELGVSLEVLPHGTEGGDLIDLGQGALQLRYQNSRFTAAIRTEEGQYSITSDPIFPGRWFQLAVRYSSGQLTLHVDQEAFVSAASGDLDYVVSNNDDSQTQNPAVGHDLVIGGDFTGRMNSLKWYDLGSQPVMAFADGSSQATVAIDADGSTDLELVSQGNMHQNGSVLGLQRIAIHTAEVKQYASLLSLDAFVQIAGQYAVSLSPDAPEINLAAVLAFDQPQPQYAHFSLNQSMFPVAHAGILDFAWGLVNWVIPIESIGIVFQQLGYLTGIAEGEFQADEFIIALVDVFTILPPAKPLKLFIKPLRALTKGLRTLNPKFMRYFAGVLTQVLRRAKRGEFDTLWNLLPFMVLAAQLYTDEEAREGLVFLISTIDSADDVLSWVDYLALPTNGWEGNDEIPEVDPFAGDDQLTQSLPISDSLFDYAHAQNTALIARISKKVLGIVLKKVAKQMTKGEAKNLPDALKILKQEIKDLDIPDFRKFIHSPAAMKSSAWLMAKSGARSVRNFIRGRGNARYSLPVILATTAYLGWESTCGTIIDGELDYELEEGEVPPTADVLGCDVGKTTGLNSQVRLQVVKKMAAAFGDTVAGAEWKEEPPSDDEFSLTGSGHGAMFHLVQTAFFQLQHRFSGGKPVKFMEKQRWVTIQKDEIGDGSNIDAICGKSVGNSNCFLKRSRNIDIVLGNGEVSFENGAFKQDGLDEAETWIELKSWAAQGESAQLRMKFQLERRFGKLEPWEVNGTKGKKNWSTHAQFSLDRAATNVTYAWPPKSETGSGVVDTQQKVEDFRWYFQAFKVNKRNSSILEAISPKLGTGNDKDSFRGMLRRSPKVSGNTKFKEPEVKGSTFGSDGARYENKAKLFTVREMATLMVRAGFEEFSLLDDLEVDID